MSQAFSPRTWKFRQNQRAQTSQQSARVSDIFNRRWQIWDVLGKIAFLDVFGQKCPGGVREASARRPGGIREASGRCPGRVRRRCKREKFQEFGRTTPKLAFSKKIRKTKKNGFLRFGAPIKMPETKNRIFGLPSTQKKTQKHKKTWICVFALQKCPKTPENWIFPCICPDTPKKRLLHFHDKKTPEATQKWNFHVLALAEQQKEKRT